MRYLLLSVLVIFSVGLFTVPGAFADDAIVTNAPGSSTPGCEEDDLCFMPSTAIIFVGEKVVWINSDNAAHTATAGSPSDGPSGVFDSSLIMAGGSYSVTLEEVGTYDYFCAVHPWMEGTVIVEEEAEPESEPEGSGGSGMSLSTECSGSTCAISGDTDRTDQDVILVVKDSNGGILNVGVLGISGGSFSDSLNVSPLVDGTYTISVNQGSSSKYNLSVSIDVSGGSSSSFAAVTSVVAAAAETGDAEATDTADNSTSTTPPPEPEAETIPPPNIVYNAPGSSTPGCEPNCFIPSTIAVAIGEIVTWENTDTAAHTATSGGGSDGPSGVFDSSLIMAGGSYSYTADTAGTFDYFCMVHPWMEGTLIVGTAEEVAAATAAQAAEVEAAAEAAAAEAAEAEAAAQAAAEEAAAQAAAAEAAAQAATWAEDNPGMILNQAGSSTPGCEPNCFIPNPLTIEAGDTVTWINGDNAAHTATAGSAADGPSGVFDSSLIMAGGSYSTTFYDVGTYSYFCMVHPWMSGTLIVEGVSQPEPESAPEAVETEAEVVTESDEITTGSEIQIQTDIVNQQDGSQIFAYIVQIKYEDGTPISISTITGSLAQGQTLTQSISWTPDEPGTYVAEIFIWDDLDSANPLSTVEVQYFTVT